MSTHAYSPDLVSADLSLEPIAGSVDRHLPLSGRTVLVVEDDYLVAEDFAEILREAGAEVIGPAETLPQAMRLAHGCDTLDCALLDVDLQGVAVFPLAMELKAAQIHILFLTGLGCDAIPSELADIQCIAKPTGALRVIEELKALLGPLPQTA